MWIQTQNKQKIINSDQIIDIFIDKTGTKIMAETTRDGNFFTLLGEYPDRDTCMKILDHMSAIIGTTGKIAGIAMPLGGQIKEWCKCMGDLAQAFVIQNFLK